MALPLRTLHGASSGRAVRVVQEALADLGFAPGQVDGVYGRRTEATVQEFQRRLRLTDDGVVGTRTMSVLAEAMPDADWAVVRRALPLHSATTGKDVEGVQSMLRSLGFRVAPDGIFGPSTERAVSTFQRRHGLRPDGVVGPDTYAALEAALDAPDQAPQAPETVSAEPARPAPATSRPAWTPDARELLDFAGLVHEPKAPWAVDVVRAAWLVSERESKMADGGIAARFGAVALPLVGRPRRANLAGKPPGWLTARAVTVCHAVERDPAAPVDIRHVLAAAVAGEGARYVEEELRRRGAPADTLRLELLNAILAARPGDDATAWAGVLRVPLPPGYGAALSGGYATDHVPTEPTEPLVDHLGLNVYVRMLALLVADSRTKMPLSIGLFGEWGSGKSYFMGLLRQAVADLAEEGPPYQRDVVQITFNAWHYSDTNLWASLADEIFEQLAGPLATADEDEASRRERLRSDLTQVMQRRKELAEQTESAEKEVAELRRKVQAAEVSRDAQRKAFAEAVGQEPGVKAALDVAARKLGFDNAERARFRELAAEVRGARADATAAWRYFTGRPWGVASVVLTVAFVVLLTLAPVVAGRLRDLVGGLSAASVAAAAGTAAVRVKQTRTGLAKLREAAEAADRVERARAAEPTDEANRLRAAETRLDTLSVQLHEAVARVGELGRELAELSAGHRLYRFIAERAASDDYRRHLGIVSAIRRDFEQLVELMKQWGAEREKPVDDGTPPPPRPVDRIVLYIDDLDRCSAEQVVDVLQAVHLLLAMDLFVVVVGVDPRWLLRALRRQYAGILDAGGDGAWTSTPHDYLEKIFNIPFALRDLTPNGYAQLLAGIVGEVERRGTVDGDGLPETPVAAPDQPAESTLRAEEGSEISRPSAPATAPSIRPMTEAELDYLATLAPFVRTPRAATRMLNVYRMLRSTKDLSASGVFLRPDGTGEYRAVAQLLAVLTAYPRVLGQLLYARPEAGAAGGLLHRTAERSWQAFVAGLAVRDGRNDVIGGIDPADQPVWDEVAGQLAAWAPTLGSDDPAPFRDWGPHVARFSFQPARFAR